MRIHAIQTGTVAVRSSQRAGQGPKGIRLANTLLDRSWTEPMPILAWAIEHPEGVIVVDTGETASAGKPGYFPRWHPYFRLGLKEWVEPEEEIGPQLRGLGIDPRDVRTVVLTHLHTDHAGGIHHFPASEIIVSRPELATASGTMGKLRGFLPQHWPSWFSPTTVGFDAAEVPLTEAGDVLLVPTPGHTAGHMSVIVREEEHDVFLAGDVSYTEGLMLQGAVDGVSPDPQRSRQTLEEVQARVRARPTVYLPSHDPGAIGRLKDRRVAETIGTASTS